MWDVQMVGAACFGAIVGWYVYYINRWRKSDVQFSDLVTLVGIIGGGAVLGLFGNTAADAPKAATVMFGAYGIGLAVGFFGYFLLLVGMVAKSPNFDVDWFLDGRSKKPSDDQQPGLGSGVAMDATSPRK